MALATLSIDLVAKIASFERDLGAAARASEKQAARIERAFGSMGTAFKALGALGVGTAFVAAVRSSADFADEMGKLSQRAGVAVEAMSGLSYAAKLADVDNQQLAKGLRELGQDVADGGKKLAALGIGLADASGRAKTADQLFAEVADRFAAMPDGIEKTNLAIDLFGDKVGPQLIPLLNSGARGLRDAADEAQRFGRIISEDAAKEAEQFNDNLTKLEEAAAGLASRIGNAVIPVIVSLSNEFLTGTKHANGLLDAILTFGTINPFRSQVGNIKELREDLADLEADRVRYQRANSDTSGIDAAIATTKKKLAYLNDLQRQAITIDPNDQSAAEAQRLGLTKPVATRPASKPGSGGRSGGRAGRSTGKDPQLEANEREAGMLKLLDDIKQKELKQSRQYAIDELEAVEKVNDEYQDLIKNLLDATPTAQLDKQRQTMLDLAAAFESGQINAEQFGEAASTYLGNLPKELKEANSAAAELGMTFASAFEDALVSGASLKDVLKGLEQDIIRIVTRKLVTEPLANWATTAIGAWASTYGFADGGVMTPSGPLPLRTYARGGVASSPQVAVYGEGSMNEAYVPLPDGRRIPVALQGGRGGQGMGGNVTHMSFNFNVPATVDRRTQEQMAHMAGAAVQRANRRLS